VLLFDSDSTKWYRSETWRQFHRVRFRWILAVTVVALLGYAAEACSTGSLPGGSSLSGGLSGLLAGLLIIYLFLYGCRKVWGFRWIFRRRSTAHQLARHIWLGLLTFPLVFLHSGCLLRWGGLLTTALLGVYLGVFASGLWGLWVQQRFPKRLLRDLPDETIRVQIPALLERLHQEALLLLRAVCGPSPHGTVDALADETARQAVRDARRQRGAGLLRPLHAVRATEEEGRLLWGYFHREIDPYLLGGEAAASRLRLPAQAEKDFDDLRSRVNPDLAPFVDALQEVCARRRQLDDQVRLHDRLHGWIGFHLVLSAALLVLLVWHGVTALLYW
jgi:hypothetical protein